MVRFIPNFLTLFRIFLIWPLSVNLLAGQYREALFLFLLAGLTDGIDGWMARHFDCVSDLGSVFDPIADKLLLVFTYLFLLKANLVPGFLFVAVLSREILIVSGAVIYYSWFGRYQMSPTKIGKFCTFFHFLFLSLVLSAKTGIIFPPNVLALTLKAAFVITLVSGLQYVVLWSLKAYRTVHPVIPPPRD